MHNVSKVMDNLPTDLHITYAAILDRIPKKQTIYCEIHPALYGWREAAVAKKGHPGGVPDIENDPLERTMDIDADFFAPCASIIISSDTVNFCHQSVKDFFLDGKVAKDWHFTEYDANLRLLQLCWKTLKNQPRIACGPRDVCAPEGSVLELHKPERNELQALYGRDPFLRYSLYQWESHAIASYQAPDNVAIQEAYTSVPGVDLTNASRLYTAGWFLPLATTNGVCSVGCWNVERSSGR
jgi:hypothetical protein